jgi:hypothetical protein
MLYFEIYKKVGYVALALCIQVAGNRLNYGTNERAMKIEAKRK